MSKFPDYQLENFLFSLSMKSQITLFDLDLSVLPKSPVGIDFYPFETDNLPADMIESVREIDKALKHFAPYTHEEANTASHHKEDEFLLSRKQFELLFEALAFFKKKYLTYEDFEKELATKTPAINDLCAITRQLNPALLDAPNFVQRDPQFQMWNVALASDGTLKGRITFHDKTHTDMLANAFRSVIHPSNVKIFLQNPAMLEVRYPAVKGRTEELKQAVNTSCSSILEPEQYPQFEARVVTKGEKEHLMAANLLQPNVMVLSQPAYLELVFLAEGLQGFIQSSERNSDRETFIFKKPGADQYSDSRKIYMDELMAEIQRIVPSERPYNHNDPDSYLMTRKQMKGLLSFYSMITRTPVTSLVFPSDLSVPGYALNSLTYSIPRDNIEISPLDPLQSGWNIRTQKNGVVVGEMTFKDPADAKKVHELFSASLEDKDKKYVVLKGSGQCTLMVSHKIAMQYGKQIQGNIEKAFSFPSVTGDIAANDPPKQQQERKHHSEAEYKRAARQTAKQLVDYLKSFNAVSPETQEQKKTITGLYSTLRRISLGSPVEANKLQELLDFNKLSDAEKEKKAATISKPIEDFVEKFSQDIQRQKETVAVGRCA